jgi:hypothetical protein
MLRSVASLKPRHFGQLAVASAWIVAARLTLATDRGSLADRQRPLERLARWLPALTSCSPSETAWAITAVARRLPGTRCLAWSLAVRGMLAQAGVPADLKLGVARRQPDGLDAHAWVESGGVSWSWGAEAAAFTVLRPRTSRG